MLLPSLCWGDTVDSLRQVVEQSTGVERIESLRALSEALENESFEAAREASQEAVNLSRELENNHQLGLSLSNLAIQYDLFGRYSKALKAFREAASLLKQYGKADEIANNDIYMGMAFHHLGVADSSRIYCERGRDSFFELKDSLGYSESLNSLGLIQKESGEYTESTNSFYKALDWAPKNHKSHIVGNIGVLFFELQEGEKALDYFRQCYALELAKDARIDIGYTLGYLGAAHYSLRNADSALYYFRKAYEWNLEVGHREMIGSSLHGLLKVLKIQGKDDEVIKIIDDLTAMDNEDTAHKFWIPDAKWNAFEILGERDSTIKYLHITLDNSLKNGDWSNVLANSNHLSRNYAEAGDYKKSLEYFQLHARAKDSIFSTERTQIIQELNTEYETEKREAEILGLKKEKANERFRTNAWILGAILIGLIGAGLLLFQSVNARQKREIKLGNLRTQIASDLHDEMGSLLTGISMQAQMMQYSEGTSLDTYRDKIIDNSQTAIATMRDVIWSIDSRYDQLGGLIDRMKELAFELLNPLEIKWDFQVDGWDLEQAMSPDVRQNLYLIFKEAINNIVKHAPQDEVKISLHQRKDQWSLKVQNQSPSVPRSETPLKTPKTLGQGLKNMEMRAKQIGAKLQLQQGSGFSMLVSGTTLT